MTLYVNVNLRFRFKMNAKYSREEYIGWDHDEEQVDDPQSSTDPLQLDHSLEDDRDHDVTSLNIEH